MKTKIATAALATSVALTTVALPTDASAGVNWGVVAGIGIAAAAIIAANANRAANASRPVYVYRIAPRQIVHVAPRRSVLAKRDVRENSTRHESVPIRETNSKEQPEVTRVPQAQ
jgi:hypothetical protein